jgi:hypothetical protein
VTLGQAKVATAGVLAFLAWLFGDRPAPARVVKELEIDADVGSDTFGQPIASINPSMANLINESDAAIRRYDAAHPEQAE